MSALAIAIFVYSFLYFIVSISYTLEDKSDIVSWMFSFVGLFFMFISVCMDRYFGKNLECWYGDGTNVFITNDPNFKNDVEKFLSKEKFSTAIQTDPWVDNWIMDVFKHH